MANHTENWDSATPPSPPSGWTFGAGITTNAPGSSPTPISSPNCLKRGAGAVGTTAATWGTADTNSGNVSVQGTGQQFSGSSLNQKFSVLARGSNSSLNLASHTMYEAQLKFTGTLTLNSIVSGTASALGSSLSFTAATGEWYQMTLTCNGTSITIQVQRLSDGFWLDNLGNFGSGAATAITRTDSSVTGAGYAGWYAFAPSNAIFGDDWSLTELSPSSAALSATESGDTLAGSGKSTTSATLVGAGRNDAFAGSGGAVPGVMAATERHDSAAILGWCVVASMSATGRDDAFAGSGRFATSAGISATSGNDTSGAFGRFSTSATISKTESGDTMSAGGKNTAFASATLLAGGADTFVGFGTRGTKGPLAATEQHDTLSAFSINAARGSIGRTEGADTAGFIAGNTHASIGVTDGSDVMVAFTGGVGYHIYSNSGIGDPIDYTTPIDTTGQLTWTSGVLAFPATWSFGVRAYDRCGEESNIDCAVTFILDASGIDITNRPLAPVGLRGFATAGGSVKLEWTQPPSTPAKAPTGFHVYYGIAAVDYTTVRATVTSASAIAGHFFATISGLTDGQAYRFSVRAFNLTAEEQNTAIAIVTADATGPSAVSSLTATAV